MTQLDLKLHTLRTEIWGLFDGPYSGIRIHGIDVRCHSFLWRHIELVKQLLLKNAVLNISLLSLLLKTPDISF